MIRRQPSNDPFSCGKIPLFSYKSRLDYRPWKCRSVRSPPLPEKVNLRWDVNINYRNSIVVGVRQREFVGTITWESPYRTIVSCRNDFDVLCISYRSRRVLIAPVKCQATSADHYARSFYMAHRRSEMDYVNK